MTKIITRFAPSPTGNLHIGSARTALLNFIITQQIPLSKFYLRIEDTDKLRSKEEFKQNILDGLSWLGITWEDKVQIQSERIKRHQNVAKELLNNNFAYKCNCSEEKLKHKRELIKNNKNLSKKICTECKENDQIQNLTNDFVVRIKLPDEGEIIIKDKIQGNITVKNKELDDFILLRKDLTPTYMLSVVVDDNDLGVNLVLRGDDHLNNAFRQYYIYKFLNWNIPEYAHVPLIHGEDGSKLSKRHGAVDILEFKKNGYLKEAIINNLILLGWSPKNQSEIININDIINLYDIKKLSKSSSIFSYNKLNFFNNHYIRSQDGFEKFEYFCLNHNKKIMITERGTSFGYNTLVNDFKGLDIMKKYEYPVIFDATHSVQQPGGMGDKSGGQREHIPSLCKAAIAIGVAGLFIETHNDPDNAPSDGPNMINIKDLKNLLLQLKQFDDIAKKYA